MTLPVPVTEYLFENIEEDHTILVTFAPAKEYMLDTVMSNGFGIECNQRGGDIVNLSTRGKEPFVETISQGVTLTSSEELNIEMPLNNVRIEQIYWATEEEEEK